MADPIIADDPSTDDQPYTAWGQGFDAREQGLPRSLNPYDEETRDWHWWNNGWDWIGTKPGGRE